MLTGLLPAMLFVGPARERELPRDWEFAVIQEDVTRGLTEEQARVLFDVQGPLVFGPGSIIEIRHHGKVVKRYQGRYATKEEIELLKQTMLDMGRRN